MSLTTLSGSAFAGQYFTFASNTLTFAPGQTTQNVVVSSLGDAAIEGNEVFRPRAVRSD